VRNLNSTRACSRPGESRALNSVKGPCLIMAGSGMCTGGRIMHHLRHNLPVPETAVLIVGFQSQGTLGRKLVDGAKSVTIFGEEIPVRASIHTMGGFSAHADQTGLLEWFSTLAPSRPRTIITHGEDRARQVFSDLIHSRFGLKSERPALGDVIEI
jgi:metallo-beta-lactamase family protein